MKFITSAEMAEFLRQFKNVSGMTVRQLEARTGVANSTLARIITRDQVMDMATYEKLVKYFQSLGQE